MKKFALSIVCAAVMLVPASAHAKNIQQTGQIVGDKTTSVKLRVKVVGGEVRKVAGFKAKNVLTRCDSGPSRISFTALTPIAVKNDNTFRVRLTNDDGAVLRISGKVKDRGRKTVGKLKTNSFEASSGETCKTPKQKFKTSA